MSLPVQNIDNVRRNIQAKLDLARTKLAGLRAQQPLLGQFGKGQLIQNLQGRRLLRGALSPTCSTCSSPSTRSQTKKMHPGVVDTAGIGHGIPKITTAAVEQEKGAYPINAAISVEL